MRRGLPRGERLLAQLRRGSPGRRFGSWRELGHAGDWLRHLSSFRRRLLANILVGVTIEALLHLLGPTTLLGALEDATMDRMIRIYGYSDFGSGGSAATAFAFLDIDEASYRKWGEPLVTPRDKLLRLIRFAAEGQAAAVIVDVDLTRPLSEDPDRLAPEDLALVEYFHGLAAPSDRVSGELARLLRSPPVVLARTFRSPLGTDSNACPQQKVSFLDAPVRASSRVHWASVLFEREADQVIRRWRLWEPSCKDAEPEVVPAVELLSTALLASPGDGAKRLEAWLAPFLPRTCGDCGDIAARGERGGDRVFRADPRPLVLGDFELRASAGPAAQRIIYGIPWRLEHEGDQRPLVSLPDGRRAPVLYTVPASVVTESTRSLSADLVRGRIVVIGGSFVEGRDLYATPLGEMPGALILINSIHSLRRFGQLRPPPVLLEAGLLVTLIVVVSFLFTRFHHFWGMLLAGLVVIGVVAPLSFWLFKYGRWLNFALPLVGVQIHHLAAEFEDAVGSRRHSGKEVMR